MIHSLDHDDLQAHVQWFEHGNGILLRELADERQLYLTPYCKAAVPFKGILGKVTVEWNVKPDAMKSVDFHHFICKCVVSAVCRSPCSSL